ncbi:MAG: serine hydrolase [Candidatus Sumerlaeia bacterium]|nr:serine hydrolase [Candidatus Sumerlaeia bacterium]
MRTLALSLTLSAVTGAASGQLTLRPDVVTPELTAFHPLPPRDEEFSAQIRRIVQEAGLDRMTPAAENADEEDEWSSICVVDLADLSRPRVAEWCGQNMLYPASTYKMYVLGEAVRQVCAGEISLEQCFTVPEHNVRSGDRLAAGQEVSLSEILRLMCQFSDNTAANMAIDIVDRQRASALLRAMGLEGSDITRKFLPRAREDEGYAYDTAQASFELVAREELGILPDFFEVKRYRVTVERRRNKYNRMVSLSEAVVVVKIGAQKVLSVSESMDAAGRDRGPVNALAKALAKDLGPYQACIDDLRLVDFKVRITQGGTEAVTRVIIDSEDGAGRRWSTVGVSANIVDASFEALLDAIVWKLVRDGVEPVAMAAE